MRNSLNKEILRLAVPSILANITVPLVGMVDIAVAGHLKGGEGAAAFIGAVSVGTLMFNIMYWNFSFLRSGTGGLTAQAYGRGNIHEQARIFTRGLGLALALSLILLALQWPYAHLTSWLIGGTPEVIRLSLRYFFLRIWAAPATMALMAIRGWFVGEQDSVSSMTVDLTVNLVNIGASLLLGLGIGTWKGIGFDGIALGTVIAQYSGLAAAVILILGRYHAKIFHNQKWFASDGLIRDALGGGDLRMFMKMNTHLFERSLFFIAIYTGYTAIASRFGDTMLSASAIMMNILMLFSFFTDGFAYAGEALTGRFIGESDKTSMRLGVKLVFIWSMAIAALFTGIYAFCGNPLISLMTSDGTVREASAQFLPWLMIMPAFGCAAFTWDGIYLGATASKGIRNAMIWAAVAFFGVWAVVLGISQMTDMSIAPEMGIHILLAAYFAHLAARTVYLTVRYGRDVLGALPL